MEKVAVIGIGCRLPPNANSLAAFWRFLLRGGNALRPIKGDRWDWRQYFDEDPRRPGKSFAPKAASLDADYTQFDPRAFGISPREAASLDPQQRLLLEVAWEAFEDAGIPLEKLAGSPTGVFVGGFCLDHLVLNAQPANRTLINAHSAGGVMMTVLSNRLSHAFDLRGPSVSMDTACSSSLVSLHFACQSLRQRECDLALSGGVSVMTRPEFPIIMSKGHFLSPHGECHTFDETAAGYARGEGAGILVLKRLDDALAAGDQIHAVIAGTGVNQDGHTDGISLPNSEAQEALVREVYRRAGVAPGEVDYVEAHGTGTQAGDAAELRALDRNFSVDRTKPLVVGSVKTNIGHLEAVAGVAGVIKTIGVLKARQVPKNLHFKNPNPKIPFAEYQIAIPRDTTPLPPAEEKPILRAGVNSFGYGGTNAHVVLESAPPASAPASAPASGAPRLVPLSAASEEALRDLAGKFAFLLGQNQGGSLDDFAYTAAFRRSHLPVRAGVWADDFSTLRDSLIALSTGEVHEAIAVTEKDAPATKDVVFVFTGMGPQWWGMGQELIRTEPIVAAAIDEIDAFFQPLAGWSLKAAMLASEAESRMARTELAQPANFALQVALTRLWAAHGVRPAAVVGHSVGEVASAYVAGVYTLEEAVRVSFHRSQSQQRMAGLGAMLAVGLAEADALREIEAFPGVSIAAVNSFSAVTLSGDAEELKTIAGRLEERGVFQKFLRVEVAYHSPQMDPLRADLLAALADLAPKPATLPLYSTAHGAIVPGEGCDAEYWWHNVRQSVRFADATQRLIEDGFTGFLEVGPHPVLGNSIRECAAALGRRVTVFTSLRRAEPERPRFNRTLAELYAAGVALDWTKLAPTTGRFLSGPQYPWQRQTHWVESEQSRMERLGLPGPVYLNRTVTAPNPAWEVEINRNYFPFLFDHGVQDQTVFAGMAYIEAALALNERVHGRPGVILENVSFERVLVIDYEKLQILVTEFDAEENRFNIFSRVEGEGTPGQRHCRGRMIPQAQAAPGRFDLAAWRAECSRPVKVEAFYDDLRERGLHYGEAFRPTTEIHVGDGCFLLRIDASRVRDEVDHPLHPTIFDAAIQPVLFCAKQARLVVPFSFEEFQYFRRPDTDECYAFGRIVGESEQRLVADVWLTDADGTALAQVRGMALQAIEITPGSEEEIFYEPGWQVAPASEAGENPEGRRVLILADEAERPLADEIAGRLPGAEIASLSAAADLPAAHPGRDHLVLLSPAGTFFDSPALCEKIIAIFQSLGAVSGQKWDVTLVSRRARVVDGDASLGNPAAAPLAAIGLVAQNEFDGVTFRSVDLGEGSPAEDAARILAELAARTKGDIAYRGGTRREAVIRPLSASEPPENLVSVSVEEPVALRLAGKARLDSLRFASAERPAPGKGEIEVRVHRAALNQKDLLKAEGRLPAFALENTLSGAELGMEAAGVVTRTGPGSRFAEGDRVVGLQPGAFRTFGLIREEFAAKIPASLDFDAAAIPMAYLTAWRGLVGVANLQPGERVLIHQAAGNVGRAAIQIARWIGAEIFATAGTGEKRDWLRDQGIAHVHSSRDLDFGREIRAATNGEGVDVVFGALEGAALPVGVGLLRFGGRFVDTGKKDIADDRGLPLRAFDRGLTFVAVDIDRLAHERPALGAAMLRDILDLFEAGKLNPPATSVHPAREVVAAFERLADENAVGKTLLDFSTGEVERLEESASAPVVRGDGCYVVTGGTSGFGLATGRWLVERGAGEVLLVSRSGPKAPGVAGAVAAMNQAGARVEALALDVTDPAQIAALFARIAAGPRPLRGVIHGAMVMGDAMMTDVTPEDFRRVYATKAGGAAHLAAALEGHKELDFVVFYSSISALIGNRGQTSYVAANAFLDALARDLRARGCPAVSLNWGALAESGVVARDERLGVLLSTAGITGLGDREAFRALERAIRGGKGQLGIFKVDWNKWAEAHAALAEDPRFRELRTSSDAAGGGAAAQIRAALAGASPEERQAALLEHLRATLAETLKMAPDAVSTHQRLNEMGVDSLLVLELSLGIQERIGVSFSAMEFLKGPTLEQLATLAAQKLWRHGPAA